MPDPVQTGDGLKFVGGLSRQRAAAARRKAAGKKPKKRKPKPRVSEALVGGDPRLSGPTQNNVSPNRGLGPRRSLSVEEVAKAAEFARQRIEQGRPTRSGGKFHRLPGEMRAARYISSLRMDLISSEVLKLHAEIFRRVHLSVLISDVLNIWLEGATDYQHPLFRTALPPGVRHAAVPERYPGYLKSLGYVPLVKPQDEAVSPVLPSGSGLQAPSGGTDD